MRHHPWIAWREQDHEPGADALQRTKSLGAALAVSVKSRAAPHSSSPNARSQPVIRTTDADVSRHLSRSQNFIVRLTFATTTTQPRMASEMAEPETPAAPPTTTSEFEAPNDSSAVPSLPPPPVPAADPRLQDIASSENDVTSLALAAQVDDIFKVSPLAALRLLSAGIEALVSMTGDIPPTPALKSPTIPHMKGMEAEKESIVRSNSEKNLARLAQQRSGTNSPLPGRSPHQNQQPASQPAPTASLGPAPQPQAIDGVHLRAAHAAPSAPGSESQQLPQSLAPYIIVGDNSQPLNLQHSVITRKFYCRVAPPISITDYLLRIHQFCPMSTGVYLATSLYIHRLAVLERTIVVTRRNAHRLLLAGLRVAMKALEDQSYPHARFSRVGGVSDREMARLEISFCFLTGFELAVSYSVLSNHWEMLRRGTQCWNVLDEAVHAGVVFVQLEKPPSGSSDVEAQA